MELYTWEWVGRGASDAEQREKRQEGEREMDQHRRQAAGRLWTPSSHRQLAGPPGRGRGSLHNLYQKSKWAPASNEEPAKDAGRHPPTK